MNQPDAPQQPAAPPTDLPTAHPEAEPSALALLRSAWDRIKHHKIVQWTLAYLALAYTLLHGAEMLGNSLGWSHGLLRLFTLILILGVPVVITLAWYHGARGQQRVSGTEFMIIAMLLALGGTFLWRDSRMEHGDKRAATVAPAQPVSIPATPAIPDKSVAVLPFVNMSSDKEQEYFSDGLSEELLNLLTKVPQLHVAARTSSFYYKGKEVKLAEMARELHVAHLLEGSVRKSGNRVRITAQLIRAADGYHQWSETYDRTLEDIFAVQEEIAAAVVTQLKVTLLGAAPKVRKTSPEAYALFLQALQMERQYSHQGLERSILLYQQALSIDPTYTAAWVGLAVGYERQAYLGLRPADEGYSLAREAANKALAIDAEFAPAHSLLGWIALVYDDDLAAAAQHLGHALTLEPTDSASMSRAAALATDLNRLDTAIELGEYATARDPMNPVAHMYLGYFYNAAGRRDEAIASCRAALKVSPDTIEAYYVMGVAMLLKGDYRGALAAMQREPEEGFRLTGLAEAYHALGQASASDAALAELIKKHEKSWSSTIAIVFAFRGEADRAFEWMDKAVAYHDTGVVNFPIQPLLANLHNDSRWLPFLRKLGKAPEQLAAIKFEVKLPQ
jgi:TolB-like protein